jgi:hypothetical protein
MQQSKGSNQTLGVGFQQLKGKEQELTNGTAPD